MDDDIDWQNMGGGMEGIEALEPSSDVASATHAVPEPAAEVSPVGPEGFAEPTPAESTTLDSIVPKMAPFRMIVTNLKFTLSEDDIKNFFEARAGKVVDIHCLINRETQTFRGVAFVGMADRASMFRGMVLDGVDLAGRELKIGVAEEREQKGRKDSKNQNRRSRVRDHESRGAAERAEPAKADLDDDWRRGAVAAAPVPKHLAGEGSGSSSGQSGRGRGGGHKDRREKHAARVGEGTTGSHSRGGYREHRSTAGAEAREGGHRGGREHRSSAGAEAREGGHRIGRADRSSGGEGAGRDGGIGRGRGRGMDQGREGGRGRGREWGRGRGRGQRQPQRVKADADGFISAGFGFGRRGKPAAKETTDGASAGVGAGSASPSGEEPAASKRQPAATRPGKLGILDVYTDSD